MGTPVDAGAWGALLLHDIRNRARPDQLLYFYVDRDLLGRLSAVPAEDALSDFCAAVRSASGPRPFSHAADQAAAWLAAGFPGDPAFVAHLAITVLAVTEEPLGNSHGVYRRQNQLLGLPPEACEPPGYGKDVPVLWSAWNAWLNGPGREVGRASARTHPNWTLQGWARSQALIRHRDRYRIDRFFEDMRPAANGRSEMVEAFKTWLAYRGQGGADLLRRLSDDAAQSVLADVLMDEAERWRREGPRRRTSLGGLRGLLHYDDWTQAFAGAVELDPTWSGVPLDLGLGETYTPDGFDQYVLLSPGVGDARLLRDGAEFAITPTARVRLGGEPVYVLRDDPLTSGRLQARSADADSNFHVLVHSTRLRDVAAALRDAGVDPEERPCTVDGWTWLDNVRLERESPVLRLLGLAAALPDPTARARAVGGLRIGAATYLVGGEPDLVLPEGDNQVVLNGTRLELEPGQRVVSLSRECPEPGTHLLGTTSGDITLNTVSYVRETASGAGLHRPAERCGRGYRFLDATRQDPSGTELAGALLKGVDVPLPLTIRFRPGIEFLAVLEDGEVVQLTPFAPRWLRCVGVDPGVVDVPHAVRTTAPRAAFVVTRNPHTRKKEGVAIPKDGVLYDGSVPQRTRPDLRGELIAERWQWHGAPDERRQRSVLAAAIRLPNAPVEPPQPVKKPSASRRRDIVDGYVANPYDDVLTWLSEQEKSVVGAGRFAEAWAWSCRRHGMADIAGSWRLALTTLSALGHVERDFARQQVGAAPAALVSLPGSAGVSLLSGARPLRLLERLDDVDDADPAVGSAACCWTLHVRTPLTPSGVPAGPAAVYVEWDSDQQAAVEQGLTALGVVLTGSSGQRILDMTPTLADALACSAALAMSPGHDILVHHRTPSGKWEWAARTGDAAAGFYRYRLASGNRFAWRSAAGRLVEVEPALGYWLTRREAGQRTLLLHHIANVLLVPKALPLPGLTARAVVLRTGLPPHRVKGYRPQGRGEGAEYLAYENVDGQAAQAVAATLGQDLQVEYEALRTDG